MKEVIKATLSSKSFRSAAKDVRKYKEELIKKIHLFTQRLAERGVEIAKIQVAVDTGQLRDSIELRAGDVIHKGSSFIVFTNSPYAAFVEFGTGIHTNTSADVVPAVERINPEMEGGMKPRPFMLRTIISLSEDAVIKEVAKEVFGGK